MLTKYPEVQKKAQAELDAIVGSSRLPDFADRERLPYIHALISELWRRYPVTPWGQYIALGKQCTLKLAFQVYHMGQRPKMCITGTGYPRAP